MRIYLFPISTRRTLLYCSKATPTAPPSIQDRIVNKANTTWADWERSPTQWKQTLTGYGNKLFSRLPYEEWALKTLPPLSANSASNATSVPVSYPPSQLAAADVTPLLKRLANDRQSLHKQRMWGSVIIMPLTIPVGIIPLIPNIPFFYLAFRAWSHYKALYGARYLAFLLDKGLVAAQPSRELDGLYTRAPKAGSEEKVLLTWEQGKEIADRLKLPGVQVEIERAVEQVKAALVKEKAEKEEAQKQEEARKQAENKE